LEFKHNIITNSGEITGKSFSFNGENFTTIEYNDSILLNGDKKLHVKGLAEKFAAINSYFFGYLREYQIPTAFHKIQNKTTIKLLKYNQLPFVVKIFNVVDKRTAKLFSLKESDPLSLPVFEYHLNEYKDSLITESHLIAFDLCSYDDIKLIGRICSKVNAVLKSYFERRGELLAELTCVFGKVDNKLYLVDDFTPKSIKLLPVDRNSKFINPFKLATPSEVKKYTEHLFHLTSS
jgi:phosphoribosylaminoimidazole-succinocarboxamide synthase